MHEQGSQVMASCRNYRQNYRQQCIDCCMHCGLVLGDVCWLAAVCLHVCVRLMGTQEREQNEEL